MGGLSHRLCRCANIFLILHNLQVTDEAGATRAGEAGDQERSPAMSTQDGEPISPCRGMTSAAASSSVNTETAMEVIRTLDMSLLSTTQRVGNRCSAVAGCRTMRLPGKD